MATNGGDGKQEFVRQMLDENSKVDITTINQAWLDSGHSGSISRSTLGKIKKEMGLIAATRKRPKPAETAAKRPGRKPSSGSRRGRRRQEAREVEPPKADGTVTEIIPTAVVLEVEAPSGSLLELEGDLDRILFRVMALPGLNEVEDAIRQVRRLLILKGHSS